MSHEIHGQWIGEFTGTNIGTAILNVEKVADGIYLGRATIIDLGKGKFTGPWLTAELELTDTNPDNITANLVNFTPVHPETYLPTTAAEIQKSYPELTGLDNLLPKSGKMVAKMTRQDSLEGEWKTDIETNGIFRLSKSRANQPTVYAVNIKTWEQFKVSVSGFNEDTTGKYIFRGQPHNMRLRTSFHRAGKSDLFVYSKLNIPEVSRHISSQTDWLFNINDPVHHGALLSLVQHHGYPTPLLDWTYSPYIAAYFAFSSINENHINKSENVRIYIFDYLQWSQRNSRVDNLLCALPTICIFNFVPIKNKRDLPQQSVTTFSNIDDIEQFINQRATNDRIEYLKVIDIPITERKKVLTDLYYMGITAGALFPGLDGTCKMLKEKHFMQ